MNTPHISSPMRIIPEWIDYNGHMNMAYYNMLFDRASDEFYALLGLGENYAKTQGFTTYAAEFHTCYIRELHLDDTVTVQTWLLDHDEKRFHVYQELHHADGWLAATGEGLGLHIDMSGPRVAPFPPDVAETLNRYARIHGHPDRPERAGRAIGIPRR